MQAGQVGIAAALAAGAGETAIYHLPNAVAFGLVVASAVVGVISANLPSWGASDAVAAAATAAEQPKAQGEHAP